MRGDGGELWGLRKRERNSTGWRGCNDTAQPWLHQKWYEQTLLRPYFTLRRANVPLTKLIPRQSLCTFEDFWVKLPARPSPFRGAALAPPPARHFFFISLATLENARLRESATFPHFYFLLVLYCPEAYPVQVTQQQLLLPRLSPMNYGHGYPLRLPFPFFEFIGLEEVFLDTSRVEVSRRDTVTNVSCLFDFGSD